MEKQTGKLSEKQTGILSMIEEHFNLPRELTEKIGHHYIKKSYIISACEFHINRLPPPPLPIVQVFGWYRKMW